MKAILLFIILCGVSNGAISGQNGRSGRNVVRSVENNQVEQPQQVVYYQQEVPQYYYQPNYYYPPPFMPGQLGVGAFQITPAGLGFCIFCLG